MPSRVSTPRVIGLSGGTNTVVSLPDSMRESRLYALPGGYHDAAAVLVAGGRIIGAVEEERLNRLKHTNRHAINSIHACLRMAGLTPDDVDRFAYYGLEADYDKMVANHMLLRRHIEPIWKARDYYAAALSYDLKSRVGPERIAFVEHHVTHAMSAYAAGPYADALVITLDGYGNELSGTVWAGRGGSLERLLDIPEKDSLGILYLRTIDYLGYQAFDEYKVMGLAPYGDPSRYRHLFEPVCQLLPEGRYEIAWDQMPRVYELVPAPRRDGEPLTDVHRDIAAALQETVERAVFHLLAHYRAATGLRHLCLAGGVAHNSTMVGRIAASGLFDGLFTQPAAGDSGCAIGAALQVYRELAPDVPIEPMAHAYLGADIETEGAAGPRLEAWADLVDVRRVPDLAAEVAALLDDDAVLGWVQGRSEFGPRALGNRSILADPRPARNKDRINELVKKREEYRPFAPSVLEEHANDWFDMPAGSCADFMTFTVPVKVHARQVLGAVTHVDGSARVQTVSRTTNERFWNLIEAFRRRTGVPVLLNTSFNHSIEPIVDSIEDAVTCYLTTGLTHLVVGDYLITRRETVRDRVWRLVPVTPAYVRITKSRELDTDGVAQTVYRCEHTITPARSRRISAQAWRLLDLCEDRRPLGELIDHVGAGDVSPLAAEIEALWAQRLLRLLPPSLVGRRQDPAREQPAYTSGVVGASR